MNIHFRVYSQYVVLIPVVVVSVTVVFVVMFFTMILLQLLRSQ